MAGPADGRRFAPAMSVRHGSDFSRLSACKLVRRRKNDVRNLAGFPNGRRLEDDVVDIELRAFACGYGPIVGPIIQGFGFCAGTTMRCGCWVPFTCHSTDFGRRSRSPGAPGTFGATMRGIMGSSGQCSPFQTIHLRWLVKAT